MFTSPDASADELWGRIAAIQQYRPLLNRMEEQVAGMQRLGKKLNEQFVEVDQELRLASRLQRDFLPKQLPAISDIRFHVLYRPATWVCGDVYDVQRLDETFIGLYLADAVGHGVAAGLLTMFIKQAITGKRIYQDGYLIVPPHDVLEQLNSQLADQHLPNCQFVTACYATIDLRTREICLARGGHPHPIHVGADGTCVEVRTVGGLLGIFHGETFPSTSCTATAWKT
jgi:serine phosphatase RsbU (regulator of sigma subunit)